MRAVSLTSTFFLWSLLLGVGVHAVQLSGKVNNAVQAASLQSAAHRFTPGSYKLRNVKTGKYLTYTADGNHVAPASGSGSTINVLQYGGAVTWLRLQIGSKNKCLSAQWGGSYNLAAVMYECAVGSGGGVKKGNTLEPTKQWWLAVPVSDYTGSKSASNQFLIAAQKDSVKTREDAYKNGTSKNKPFKHGKRSQKANHRRATKKASRKVASKVTAVKANVISGQKYFIIPTDHLIDMKTLALTGKPIRSAGGATSTALDAWSPSDTYQQWVVVAA